MNPQDSIKKYREFLSRISSRKGVKELASYLEKHGYLTAPASTKFHLCVESGLIMHSISVCETALKIKEALAPSYPDSAVILCSLFHDAHKATDGFENETYQKNSSFSKEKQPYFWNKKQLSFSGAHKSLLLISKFVDLSKEEMQAIAYHDGPYVPSFEDIKYGLYPLTLIIHSADLWSTRFMEDLKDPEYDDTVFLKDAPSGKPDTLF